MGHPRICESERNYRKLELSGELGRAASSYAIGQRSSDTLDILARAKVWADNCGQWVRCPPGFDRGTWNDILSDLVLRRLGNRRCLDCGAFFSDERPNARCFLSREPHPISVVFCPHCQATVSDVIECTVGVVR